MVVIKIGNKEFKYKDWHCDLVLLIIILGILTAGVLIV